MIETVDSLPIPANNDVLASNLSKRKDETYGVIDLSEDEVFQNCLYDWYLSKDWAQRLLDLTSPYVVAYLTRKSENEPAAADLLWKYHVHHHDYFEAAKIQLKLATSAFAIDLQSRIEYLSRAKANASTRTSAAFGGRANGERQKVLRDITDTLDCASVQLDILRRLENDPRLQESNREVLKRLNGKVLGLNELFNEYVIPAGYPEIALVIFYLGDFRNASDIRNSWTDLIAESVKSAEDAGDVEPYVRVSERVRAVGYRVNCSESVFNPRMSPSLPFPYVILNRAKRANKKKRSPPPSPATLLPLQPDKPTNLANRPSPLPLPATRRHHPRSRNDPLQRAR